MRQTLTKVFLFSVAVITASSALAQGEQKPRCLSYTSVGMSDCKEEVVSATETPSEEPRPVVEFDREPQPTAPAQSALDDRIDDFLENHGKPPREFVAFSLEPTLENALIWAQKYREMLDRNKRLTDAWQQAQQILDSRLQTGEEVPALPVALPPVPDFSPLALQETQKGRQPQPERAARPLAHGFSADVQDVKGGRIGGAQEVVLKPISISYYFSAECPYCQKFEKELKIITKDMGKQLDLTCVDMTPSGQEPSNVLGKVDCAWRPLQVGEMDKMGIKSTPTLIIDRNQGGSLERVTGFVDAKSLKKYLLGK